LREKYEIQQMVKGLQELPEDGSEHRGKILPASPL